MIFNHCTTQYSNKAKYIFAFTADQTAPTPLGFVCGCYPTGKVAKLPLSDERIAINIGEKSPNIKCVVLVIYGLVTLEVELKLS